jgi:hypothetical protein
MLARLEGRVALEEWFARVSSFDMAGQPEFVPSMGARGFQKMPVAFTRRATQVAVTPGHESGVNVVATAEKIAHKSNAELGLDKRAMTTVKVAAVRSLSPTVKMFRLIHPLAVCWSASRREVASSSTCVMATIPIATHIRC